MKKKEFKTAQFCDGQEVRLSYAWVSTDGTSGSRSAKLKIVRQVSEDEYLVEHEDGFRDVQSAEDLEAVQ